MKQMISFMVCISLGIASEGKIGGVTYFDYTSVEGKSAFELKRQYFSYGIDMSDDMKFKVVFDVGRTNVGTFLKDNVEKSEDSRLVVFLKKAQVDYKTSFGNISMGMIGMNTHAVQENNWGHRFIEKSAMDKNKFSTSADLGIGLSHSTKSDFGESFNMSLQIVNGEGYAKPQGDEYHKISINTTLGEIKLNKNDGYNIGLVYSTEGSDNELTNVVSFFGGFAGAGLRLGAEYNSMSKGDHKGSLMSASVNYGAMEKLEAFIRYDMYDEDTGSDGDGKNYIIAGASFKCGKGLSIAPNVRIYTFENKSDSKTSFVINFQYKF